MEPLRPFEKGDEVVLCPEYSNCQHRGAIATVLGHSGALDVNIHFDVPPHIRGTVKAYDLRLAATCETCVFRSFHVIGTRCPKEFGDIKEIPNE